VNPPNPAAVPSGLPDPERHLRLARLENKITELAAHINAATFQLLKLICEYDEQDGWWQHGVASCAHWLQWQCGTTIGVAREKVRMARALPKLPKISKSFSKGRISYSKVRPMTRVATPKNEKFLLKIAHHGTAAHVEKVVSNYRRGKRLEILYEENNRHAHRELSWYMDGDGMWVFKGKFTAEQGALIATALEGAMDELFEEQRNEPSDVFAETSRRMACDASVVHWHEAKDGEPRALEERVAVFPRPFEEQSHAEMPAAVAAQLPADRGGRASQRYGDRSDRMAGDDATRNLLAFRQGQGPPGTLPRWWADPAGLCQNALNRGMVSIKQASDRMQRLTLLPAIPHQGLVCFGVINPLPILLHKQHPPPSY
jgi:hypothetical protein